MESQRNHASYRDWNRMLRNLCFHVANAILHDVKTAETVSALAVQRGEENMYFLSHPDRDEIKAFYILIARHLTSVAQKRNLMRGAEAGSGSERPEPPQFTEPLVIDRMRSAFAYISIRDRIVLLLNILFSLREDEIAKILHMKGRSAVIRRERALSYLHRAFIGNTMMENAETAGNGRSREHQGDRTQREFEEQLVQIASSWMRETINTYEALANMDPHVFSNSLSAEALWAQNHMKNEAAYFLKKHRRHIYLGAGILFLLIILSIVLTGIRKKARDKERTESIALSLSLASQSEESIVIKTVSVKRSLSAFLPGEIIFVDEQTSMLYESKEGEAPRGLMDLSKAVLAHYGIDHIGKIGDIIYLAFLDGTGASISGSPLKLEGTEYWQKKWFSNQSDTPFQPRVNIEGVLYEFELSDLR